MVKKEDMKLIVVHSASVGLLPGFHTKFYMLFNHPVNSREPYFFPKQSFGFGNFLVAFMSQINASIPETTWIN